MIDKSRILYEAATEVRRRLHEMKESHIGQINQQLENLYCAIGRVRKFQRRLVLCSTRTWKAALRRTLQDMEGALHDVLYQKQNTEYSIFQAKRDVPKVVDVFGELKQMEDEFSEVSYDRDESVLSVITEPVVLEGVHLGEFEIRLYLGQMSSIENSYPFNVVALDPNPTTGDDSVTHPHVRDECLCTGDGSAAIKNSLINGRVCDFFSLVRSILNTYNANSPHVSLSKWHGIPCSDCGDSVNPDESYFCQFCESDLCPDCSSICQSCEGSACLRCIQTCRLCDEPVCPRCIVECQDCNEELCMKCLDDDKCPCNQIEVEENRDGTEQEKGQGTAVDENKEPKENFETSRTSSGDP